MMHFSQARNADMRVYFLDPWCTKRTLCSRHWLWPPPPPGHSIAPCIMFLPQIMSHAQNAPSDAPLPQTTLSPEVMYSARCQGHLHLAISVFPSHVLPRELFLPSEPSLMLPPGTAGCTSMQVPIAFVSRAQGLLPKKHIKHSRGRPLSSSGRPHTAPSGGKPQSTACVLSTTAGKAASYQPCFINVARSLDIGTPRPKCVEGAPIALSL